MRISFLICPDMLAFARRCRSRILIATASPVSVFTPYLTLHKTRKATGYVLSECTLSYCSSHVIFVNSLRARLHQCLLRSKRRCDLYTVISGHDLAHCKVIAASRGTLVKTEGGTLNANKPTFRGQHKKLQKLMDETEFRNAWRDRLKENQLTDRLKVCTPPSHV